MSAQASTGSTSATPSSLVVGCDNASSGAKEEAVEFVAISRSTHVYRPKKGVKQAKKDASSSLLSPIKVIQRGVLPNAVVILGWMDAPMRIVSKYAAPYAKLFPQATIIVKLSSGQSFMAGKAAQEAALQGVIRELEDVQRSVEAKSQLQSQVADLEKSANQAGLRLDVDSQNQLQEKAQSGEQSDASSSAAQASGILIHSFSDGGAKNLSQLLGLFEGRNVPPTIGLIFDCSPGKSTPRSGSTAFTIPLAKRPILRFFVRNIIYLFFSILRFFRLILRQKSWSEIMRYRLNSPRLWKYSESLSLQQGARKGEQVFPPRLYLYSKADSLIEWTAVEEHAREAARKQGLPRPVQVGDLSASKGVKSDHIVALRRWEDAKHCDLGRADFEGYWTAVRTFLQTVLDK